MKKLIQWFTPAFSGDDNKASVRRILAFVIAILYIYISAVFVLTGADDAYKYFTILTAAVTFMVLMNIIYPHHIIQAIKAAKSFKKDTANAANKEEEQSE
jgi:uncharacterized membrane protein YqjE